MPVDQTGENILFVMAEEYTEAHIQIQYDPTTPAEQFAWVVPLTELPEFGVGSDLLFDAVLNSTVPAYGFTNTFTGQGCDDFGSDTDGSATTDPTGAGGTSGDSGFGGSSGGEEPGPEILLNEVVGAFEITVLQGDSVEEVTTWLNDNDYAQDPNADPILAEYLEEGYLFAAFKLTTDAETSEIHPITLRFPNNEACIPLRLTRIAAVDDMDIRSFFFSDNRVVPSTYNHVLVNPLKLDWPSSASNYKSVITQAVDADEANGRAFVTEYAGRSDVVSPFGLFSDQWDAVPFESAPVVGVVDILENQDLMTCFEGGGFGTTSTGGSGDACQYNHPLLRGLLQSYLPVPEGVDEISFYGCLSCFEDQINQEAWDGMAFAAALQSRIIDPGQNAISILDAFPTLTRMYTTISPGEMTADPFFYQNADLPDVDFTNELAQRGTGCDTSVIWTLPDGREVYAPSSAWPEFEDEMPWEEEVAAMMPAGAPMVLVNQTENIDAQLATHNCQFDFPSGAACGNPGGDTDGETTGDTDGSGSDSMGTATSGSDTDGDTPNADGTLDDDGGCSCSARNDEGGAAFLIGLFGLMFARRRRS